MESVDVVPPDNPAEALPEAAATDIVRAQVGWERVGVGYVVGGKYELQKLLGRGSMGEVWVAHHQTLGEKVAVKLLTRAALAREDESDSNVAARFRFEGQV